MKYIRTILLALTLTLGAVCVLQKPAPLKREAFWTVNTSIIYVEETVNGVWDSQLRSALAYVDARTGQSRMVLGKCRNAYRCLRIAYGNPGRGLIGAQRAGRITVRQSWYGYQYNRNSRRNLLIHELGHAFGLGHTRTPVSVMYPNLYHNGHHMRASTFNNAQLAVLRRQ